MVKPGNSEIIIYKTREKSNVQILHIANSDKPLSKAGAKGDE
jgi:hypothetical protein